MFFSNSFVSSDSTEKKMLCLCLCSRNQEENLAREDVWNELTRMSPAEHQGDRHSKRFEFCWFLDQHNSAVNPEV